MGKSGKKIILLSSSPSVRLNDNSYIKKHQGEYIQVNGNKSLLSNF